MALADYTGLCAAIPTWLRRADLTASVPDFVTMAEAQLNRKLRCQPMISRASTTITSDMVAAPVDFLAPRTLRITSGCPPMMLKWASSEQIDALLDSWDYSSGRPPQHYTVEGGNFRFAPDPGGSSYPAVMSYYAMLPPLAVNGTNWLLASHPDAYLYGALLQSAPYLKDDERLEVWGELFNQIITDINTSQTGQGGALQPMPSTTWAGYV